MTAITIGKTLQSHIDETPPRPLSSIFGLLIGASLFGNLADRLGRKFVFVVEMAIFTLFVSLTAIVWNIASLIFFLFCVGVSLGADYPTAHLIISESIPSRFRGRMVLGAFAFQSVGSLGGVLIGLLVLRLYPEVGAWHWMYAALTIAFFLPIFPISI